MWECAAMRFRPRRSLLSDTVMTGYSGQHTVVLKSSRAYSSHCDGLAHLVVVIEADLRFATEVDFDTFLSRGRDVVT